MGYIMTIKQIASVTAVREALKLRSETTQLLASGALAGDAVIDTWKKCANALNEDGVKLCMIVESNDEYDVAVFQQVRTAIVSGMSGERTRYLLSVESKQLSDGDDKSLRALAEGRLKEHLRAVRKYLKAHEETEKAEGAGNRRLLMSEKIDQYYADLLEYLNKDNPDGVKDVDVSACLVATREARAVCRAAIKPRKLN
jgi:riboflavin synthase